MTSLSPVPSGTPAPTLNNESKFFDKPPRWTLSWEHRHEAALLDMKNSFTQPEYDNPLRLSDSSSVPRLLSIFHDLHPHSATAPIFLQLLEEMNGPAPVLVPFFTEIALDSCYPFPTRSRALSALFRIEDPYNTEGYLALEPEKFIKTDNLLLDTLRNSRLSEEEMANNYIASLARVVARSPLCTPEDLKDILLSQKVSFSSKVDIAFSLMCDEDERKVRSCLPFIEDFFLRERTKQIPLYGKFQSVVGEADSLDRGFIPRLLNNSSLSQEVREAIISTIADRERDDLTPEVMRILHAPSGSRGIARAILKLFHHLEHPDIQSLLTSQHPRLSSLVPEESKELSHRFLLEHGLSLDGTEFHEWALSLPLDVVPALRRLYHDPLQREYSVRVLDAMMDKPELQTLKMKQVKGGIYGLLDLATDVRLKKVLPILDSLSVSRGKMADRFRRWHMACLDAADLTERMLSNPTPRFIQEMPDAKVYELFPLLRKMSDSPDISPSVRDAITHRLPEEQMKKVRTLFQRIDKYDSIKFHCPDELLRLYPGEFTTLVRDALRRPHLQRYQRAELVSMLQFLHKECGQEEAKAALENLVDSFVDIERFLSAKYLIAEKPSYTRHLLPFVSHQRRGLEIKSLLASYGHHEFLLELLEILSCGSPKARKEIQLPLNSFDRLEGLATTLLQHAEKLPTGSRRYAKALLRCRELDLEFPFRASPSTFSTLVSHRRKRRLSQSEMDRSVIVFACKTDRSLGGNEGHTYTATYTISRGLEQLVQNGYFVRYHEISSRQNLLEIIRKENHAKNAYSAIVHFAHGGKDYQLFRVPPTGYQTLQSAREGIVRIEDYDVLSRAGLGNILQDEGLYINISCSPGRGHGILGYENNILQTQRRVCPHAKAVIGSMGPASFKGFSLEEGRLSGVILSGHTVVY
jgi:hypothetical protein